MSVDVHPVTVWEARAVPWQAPARAGEKAVAMALFAAGAFFAWQSLAISFGTVGVPGPGFFPFVLGLGLCGFALAIGVKAGRDSEPADAVEIGHRDVLVVFAALLGVCIAFEFLGALAALGLFTALLLTVLARVPVPLALASAALGMAGVWGFFKVLLGLQLPAGLLL